MIVDAGDAVVGALNWPGADLARVGGKGASLVRLPSAGLPVPAGFHLTTAAASVDAVTSITDIHHRHH